MIAIDIKTDLLKAVQDQDHASVQEWAQHANVSVADEALKMACQLGDSKSVEIIAPIYYDQCSKLIIDNVRWSVNDQLFMKVCKTGTPDLVDWFFETKEFPCASVLTNVIQSIFGNKEVSTAVIDKVVDAYEMRYSAATLPVLMFLKNASYHNDIKKMDWIEARFGLPDFPDIEGHIVHLKYGCEIPYIMERDNIDHTASSWLLERYELSAHNVYKIIDSYETVDGSSVGDLRVKKKALKFVCELTGVNPVEVDNLCEKHKNVRYCGGW